MSNLLIVRLFEITTLLVYIISAIWVWRLKQPVFTGALIGATLVFGYDWIYIQKDFFNVTYNPDLIWIPGIEIMGIREPLVIPIAYGMAFGPLAVMLVQLRESFDRRFGIWGYGVVWLMGAVGIMLYEVPTVYLLHIWTYHQLPQHLFFGVPWSDIWLAGNLVLLSYAGLRYMHKWSGIADGTGNRLSAETTWQGIVMGALPIWAAFYLTYVIQLFWYSWAGPWLPGIRPF